MQSDGDGGGGEGGGAGGGEGGGGEGGGGEGGGGEGGGGEGGGGEGGGGEGSGGLGGSGTELLRPRGLSRGDKGRRRTPGSGEYFAPGRTARCGCVGCVGDAAALPTSWANATPARAAVGFREANIPSSTVAAAPTPISTSFPLTGFSAQPPPPPERAKWVLRDPVADATASITVTTDDMSKYRTASFVRVKREPGCGPSSVIYFENGRT